MIAPDASRSILDAWDDLSWLAWLLLGFLLVLNLAVFFLLGPLAAAGAHDPVRPVADGAGTLPRASARASLCRSSTRSARPSTAWPMHWRRAMRRTSASRW